MNTLFGNNDSGAVISECQKYRYELWRIWDRSKPFVLFIMLNPSTADGTQDDPTIRRCIRFAKDWGFGGFYVGNLFAFRATDPKNLKHHDYFTVENKHHLYDMKHRCEKIVCAWGNNRGVPSYIKDLSDELYCIDMSVTGTPKHPLYLKAELTPELIK